MAADEPVSMATDEPISMATDEPVSMATGDRGNSAAASGPDLMSVSADEKPGLGAGSLPHVVGVSVCDSAHLLWRVQDLRACRAQGLVGALLGSLPRTPRQNGRMGRPLLLLPEEQRLLGERGGVATAARKQVPDEAERHLQVQRYEALQQVSYEEQAVLALEDRKSALVRAMTLHTDPDSTDVSSDSSLSSRLEALDRSFHFPRSALAVQLSTARAGLSYCPEDRIYLEADPEPVRSQAEPHTEARYQVFRDLRGRGFYLTAAGKFGGDFLVYPGDPLRFHAHFIAVCLSLDESVSLLDILAIARLGSNVKKTVLLCSATPEGGVVYTSLQWSGMV